MTTPFALSNVQGDILVGLSKKIETFFFFRITSASVFKAQLKELIPHITTADKATGEKAAIRRFKADNKPATDELGEIVAEKPLLEVVGVNVAFSQKGLVALGVAGEDEDVLKDPLFTKGQRDDAFDLHDKGVGDTKEEYTPDWDPAFLQNTKEIHGVFLITGSSSEVVNDKLETIKDIFSPKGQCSIEEVTTLTGNVRPGEAKGHEHFGYLDGISQPALDGVDNVDGKTPKPGQTLVDLGVTLLGRGKDATNGRPDWSTDGSFLAFRKLPQFVPEFDKFLADKAPASTDDFPDGPTAADILGARFVGRWKSGAPLRITPLVDDPELAADQMRNDKFKFNPNSQEICPFAAHIRKMNPRKDLPNPETSINPHLILRRGIPFGPEVTDEERNSHTTDPKNERGLYFVSYQSDLNQGFSFLQKRWANNPSFPPVQNPGVENFAPGFDPIIGQDPGEKREMTGYNDDATNDTLPLDRQWVQSKGGEYFFSPSISALKGKLAEATA